MLGRLEDVSAEQRRASFADRAQWLLDDDFLAGDLAKMGFADLLQRSSRAHPAVGLRAQPGGHVGRGLGSDGAPASGNPFDRSIGDLFALARQPRAGDPLGLWLPALLLNGTSADTGKRILTSNLTIDSRSWRRGVKDPGESPDVLSAADKLGGQPMRVSTAVHQSARFTYFSPAGRFPDGTCTVDGGYFENSGAATLLDLLDTVRPFEDRGPMCVPR